MTVVPRQRCQGQSLRTPRSEGDRPAFIRMTDAQPACGDMPGSAKHRRRPRLRQPRHLPLRTHLQHTAEQPEITKTDDTPIYGASRKPFARSSFPATAFEVRACQPIRAFHSACIASRQAAPLRGDGRQSRSPCGSQHFSLSNHRSFKPLGNPPVFRQQRAFGAGSATPSSRHAAGPCAEKALLAVRISGGGRPVHRAGPIQDQPRQAVSHRGRMAFLPFIRPRGAQRGGVSMIAPHLPRKVSIGFAIGCPPTRRSA